MKNEFLLYRFPNESVNQFSGTWNAATMNDLPNDVFFVTDFLKENVFYFDKNKNEINTSIINESLLINDEELNSVSDKALYISQLNKYKVAFEQLAIQKAILSRVIKHRFNDTVDALLLFNRLCATYPNAMVYLIAGKEFGVWCGATPEVLLSGTESELTTMALAGTKWQEPVVWIEKEVHEQGLVKEYIQEVLNRFSCKELNVSPTKTVKAGPVYHLRNDFYFSLPQKDWNNLIKELHPTPAVGGLPLQKAVELINETEVHSRKLYTGLIGFKGDQALSIYVNLRCMELSHNAAYLYVGGGITADSVPEQEWEETENKAKTLRQLFD